jgi:hypothetical protein
MSDTDIEITMDSFTLHAGEKVSTGEYENEQMDLTIEGTIDGAEIHDDIPHDVRARLLRVMKSMQKDVERAAENRIKIADQENWTPKE